MQTSEQNIEAEIKAKIEKAEIDAAVRRMKQIDWKFLGLMALPFVFGGGCLLAVALFG